MSNLAIAISGFLGVAIFSFMNTPSKEDLPPPVTMSKQVKEEENPYYKKYNPEACTDPYYTVVIRGKTYSGSTKTAHDAYLQMAEDFKEMLYREGMDEKDRWKRLKNIQEIMDGLNAFRGECEWYAKGFVSLEDFEKHATKH